MKTNQNKVKDSKTGLFYGLIVTCCFWGGHSFAHVCDKKDHDAELKKQEFLQRDHILEFLAHRQEFLERIHQKHPEEGVKYWLDSSVQKNSNTTELARNVLSSLKKGECDQAADQLKKIEIDDWSVSAKIIRILNLRHKKTFAPATNEASDCEEKMKNAFDTLQDPKDDSSVADSMRMLQRVEEPRGAKLIAKQALDAYKKESADLCEVAHNLVKQVKKYANLKLAESPLDMARPCTPSEGIEKLEAQANQTLNLVAPTNKRPPIPEHLKGPRRTKNTPSKAVDSKPLATEENIPPRFIGEEGRKRNQSRLNDATSPTPADSPTSRKRVDSKPLDPEELESLNPDLIKDPSEIRKQQGIERAEKRRAEETRLKERLSYQEAEARVAEKLKKKESELPKTETKDAKSESPLKKPFKKLGERLKEARDRVFKTRPKKANDAEDTLNKR